MNNPYKIRFTNHAISRLKESQIELKKGVWLCATAQEEKLEKGLKKNKYNNNKGINYINNKDVTFWRNGTLIFTVKVVFAEATQKYINLVLTVTDQRVMLPMEAFYSSKKH